jgi:hypothetical protein
MYIDVIKLTKFISRLNPKSAIYSQIVNKITQFPGNSQKLAGKESAEAYAFFSV